MGVFELLDAFGDGVVDVAGNSDDEIAVADFVFDLVAAVARDAVGRHMDAALEAILL